MASLPLKSLSVRPREMTHNRLLKTPTWAQRRDLRAVYSELSRIGAIRSEGEFADLMQQGRHRMFGKESQKVVFSDPDTVLFWTGMVALWMIRLHELEEKKYNAKMRSFAREGEYHQVRV